MPTPFVSICPHCQTKLKLKNPALIGKKAKCPSCQEAFVVKKAGDLAPKPTPVAAGSAKPVSKPKPKKKPRPKPDPDEELDPWLQDDLDDFGDSAPGPRSQAAAPPPVQGVRKKRKPSSADDGKQKRKKKSVSAAQVAWIGWVVGGGIAGVIGASIWGAVAAFTLHESAIIAWGIGGFVGFGVRVGAKDEDVGIAPGVTAVGIALVSVILGKFLAVHFLFASIENMIVEAQEEAGQVEYTEEETIEWIISDYADDIISDWEDEGREYSWPDWENLPDDATLEDEYPADAWTQAEARWNEMSDEEKAAEIVSYKAGDWGMEGDLGEVEGLMFANSFGILDLLFFFLAAATAFKVGSGLDFGDD